MDLHSEKEATIVGTPPPTAPAKTEEVQVPETASSTNHPEEAKGGDRADSSKKSPKNKCTKKHTKTKKAKKSKKEILDGSSSSESSEAEADEASSSSDSGSSDSESEPDANKKKKSSKKRLDAQKTKKKIKSKKVKKPIKVQVNETSDSESLSDSSDSDEALDDLADGDQQQSQQDLVRQMQLMQLGNAYQYQNNSGLQAGIPPIYDQSGIYNRLPPIGGRPRRAGGHPPARRLGLGIDPTIPIIREGKQHLHNGKHKRKSPRLDYKRVDQVWDNSIHNYKLQDTAEASAENQYEDYLFHVRRNFDWEGKYKATYIDIKSKLLRECLQDVMGNIKGVSLVEDTPKLDPNMLFLYLEEFRQHVKDLKKMKPSGTDKHERKKQQKRIEGKRQHLKVLVKYIDKDYEQVKSSLYPMLENNLITFDLLWALWKPNTLAYTTTYGSHDEPRVFKVEMAEKHHTILKGDFYYIEGKYFEYDGKQFGYGNMSEEMGDFRGARKITSLNCYPLKYHKNATQLRKDLIERGKKFVSLSGVHYKSHHGMAYVKKKKSVIKVNINGRIMVDPNVHRRINPNYPISLVRPKDHDVLSDDDESDGESACCCGVDSDHGGNEPGIGEEKPKYVTKILKDDKGRVQVLRVTKEEAGELKEKLDEVQSKDGDSADANEDTPSEDSAEKKVPEFSEEEYLIASPVVLGFAFAEKMWLEFTVSGVKEIQWNETAYDSLVLESKTKDLVKALVESHKYHAAESIDDVIQGKGRGLVAVLHGPPGTGKTLTAEGISELLKCPLYMVSAGELGTDSRFLEQELQKILDICHAWGAILLLDEADVFLEKRNMHDIHRNALVSIFLRQLEYFQGILFLTTNRVETFDDAFQSRIHIALRYDNLDRKAKKTIFKIFIDRVRVLEKVDLRPFTEEDYDQLARHDLNGRQIKNTVRAAQALAVNKGEPLAMSHIRQVLEVQMRFDRDLKGGTGYEDAMRGYF